MGESGLAFKKTGRYSTIGQVQEDIEQAASSSESSFFCQIDDEDSEGRVVGCVRLTWRMVGDEKAADIGPFAVVPATQGTGVGTQLLSRACAWAEQHGCASLVIAVVNHRTDLFRPLHPEMPPEEAPGGVEGEGFYARRGFRLVGTAPCDAAHNCDEAQITRPSHFLLLRKPLQGAP